MCHDDNSKKTAPVALGYANKPAYSCVFPMQKHVCVRANEGIEEVMKTFLSVACRVQGQTFE